MLSIKLMALTMAANQTRLSAASSAVLPVTLVYSPLGMSHQQMQQVFSEWNRGVLDSYLIEITADILAKQDTDGAPLVTRIR